MSDFDVVTGPAPGILPPKPPAIRPAPRSPDHQREAGEQQQRQHDAAKAGIVQAAVEP